jgi:hypothetical protein
MGFLGWDMKALLFSVGLLVSSVVSADTFYRCVGPDGRPLLADHPCAKDAQEIVVSSEVARIQLKNREARDYIRQRTLQNSISSDAYRFRHW